MSYKRRAHTRVVNGKTVHVKASTVGSAGGGFWAAIFGGVGSRSTTDRIRDRIAYERESYRLSGEEVLKSQQPDYDGTHLQEDDYEFGNCAKHGRRYQPTCRTCARLQTEQNLR